MMKDTSAFAWGLSFPSVLERVISVWSSFKFRGSIVNWRGVQVGYRFRDIASVQVTALSLFSYEFVYSNILKHERRYAKQLDRKEIYSMLLAITSDKWYKVEKVDRKK